MKNNSKNKDVKSSQLYYLRLTSTSFRLSYMTATQRLPEIEKNRLLDSIQGGFMSVDAGWRITYMNSEAEKISRVSFSDVAGQHFFDVFKEARGSAFDTCFTRVMNSRAPDVIEDFYGPQEGWVEVNVYPANDGGITFFYRDITARKRMEILISSQREALEAALSGNVIGPALDTLVRAVEEQAGHKALASILLMDEDGKRLMHGSAPSLPQSYCAAIDGIVIGPNVGSCGTAACSGEPVVVEDIASDPQWADFKELALAHGLRACWSVPILSQDKTVLGTFAVYYPEPRGPAPNDREVVETFLRTAAIIIERYRQHRREDAASASIRLGEERIERQRRLYETALSNTPDFVYIFSLDGRVVYANEALLTMWGRPWPETVGKKLLDLGYEAWHAEMHEREIETVKNTKKPIRGEVPFTGTHGTRIYDYIFAPVLGLDGEVEAVAGTTRDVTERKESEEALRLADQKKDEFLATLAHELRNPLAPIRNSLYVLTSETVNEDAAAQAHNLMGRQVEQMVRLVDDLMDVSRITRGKLELRKERLSLSGVIRNAVDIARSLIESRRHTLSVSLPAHEIYVTGDSVRLAQIFANLLNNAAKYTSEGGRIDVRAEQRGSELEVTISDTGIGIAQDMLPRVFDLFHQGDASLERSQGGLGVGLALVQRLVDLHGGKVQAASEGKGKGSQFKVLLPLGESDGAAAANDEAAAEAKNAPGLRVLVVDDNFASAQTLGWALEMFGCEVAIETSSKAALDTAASFRPDAALLDIGLPDMNGYDLCAALRKIPGLENSVFIAQTGWGQPEHRLRSTQAGFNHHLVKPVDLAQLRTILQDSPSASERRAV